MTEAMHRPSPPPAPPLSSEGLYFQIVCNPGHERTTRELSALPRESRERVWADIAGSGNKGMTAGANGELGPDPRVVREKLDRMDVELQCRHLPESQALQWAWPTALAQQDDFRIGFLTVSEFDPSAAAERLVRHFEQKLLLFGRSKLGSPITLNDLSEDDMECLQCGGLQFLPKTDRAGRLVMVSRYKNYVYKTKENMLRAFWYMVMSVLDTVNVTDFGYVFVGYEVDDEYTPTDNELIRQMIRLMKSLPLRILAAHSCYSASPMQGVADLIVHMVSNFVRLRLRLHHGSHQECRYRLWTMGIPVDFLPVTADGVLHCDNHRHWLKYRVQQEQVKSSLPPTGVQLIEDETDEREGDEMDL